MRTLKSRISPIYITSASLECYLPLSPSHRVTSANIKIYANEQLLPVSETSVFEFSDLMLNNSELITTCTLPAFVKFPYQLSPSGFLARPRVCHHAPPCPVAPSVQLRRCYECLPPLRVTFGCNAKLACYICSLVLHFSLCLFIHLFFVSS